MKPNSIPSAGTNAEQRTDVEDKNVSPFFAKPNVVCRAFRFVKLLIKKQKLLSKYKPSQKKISDEIHLYKLFKDDLDALTYFQHNYSCERRCYRRLQSL